MFSAYLWEVNCAEIEFVWFEMSMKFLAFGLLMGFRWKREFEA